MLSIFCPFLNVFFLLTFESSSCILDTSAFPVCDSKYFLPVLSCNYLHSVFQRGEVLNLINSNLLLFSFMNYAFGIIAKNFTIFKII